MLMGGKKLPKTDRPGCYEEAAKDMKPDGLRN